MADKKAFLNDKKDLLKASSGVIMPIFNFKKLQCQNCWLSEVHNFHPI